MIYKRNLGEPQHPYGVQAAAPDTAERKGGRDEGNVDSITSRIKGKDSRVNIFFPEVLITLGQYFLSRSTNYFGQEVIESYVLAN